MRNETKMKFMKEKKTTDRYREKNKRKTGEKKDEMQIADREEEQSKNIEWVDAEVIENNSNSTLSHTNAC